MISKKKGLRRNSKAFMAEIRNLNGFSGQKQQLFPPKNQHSNLDGGRLNLELVREMLTFKKKYSGGARNKSGGGGGGGKNKNRGVMPPCPPVAMRLLIISALCTSEAIRFLFRVFATILRQGYLPNIKQYCFSIESRNPPS